MSIFKNAKNEIDKINKIYEAHEPGLVADSVDEKKTYLSNALPIFFSTLHAEGIRRNVLSENVPQVSSALRIKTCRDSFFDNLWRLYAKYSQSMREYERVFGPGSYSFEIVSSDLDEIAGLIFF